MTAPSAQLLIKIAGPLGAFERTLEGEVVWLGRSTECELPLEHPNVSRRHLKLFRRDGKLWVCDPGSANGTLVNGEPLRANTERPLKPTDVLTLGTSGITVQASDPNDLPDETVLYAPRASIPSVIPPLPVVPVPPVVTPVRTEIPIAPRIEAAPAAPAASTAPSVNDREAEERLRTARQEAARLVQQAITEAERRVQEIYDKAQGSQLHAEEVYRQRLQQAYRDAEVIHEQHRAGAQELLQDARKQAQEIRDQAQRFASETRERTEQQCEQVLREAEEQGRQIQANRLAQADEVLRQREERLMQSLKDEQAKLESLHAQAAGAHQALELVNASLRTSEEQARAAQTSLQQQMDELARLGVEKDQANAELARIAEEAKAATLTRDQLREEAARLSLETSSLSTRQKQVEEEHERQLSRLKMGFEDQRAKLAKEEEESMHQMRLESTRKVQAYEKELLGQIQGKIDLISREILLAVEAAWKSQPSGAAGEASKNDELHASILRILRGQSTGPLGAESNIQGERRKLLRARRRERWSLIAMGVVVGCVVLQAFNIVRSHMEKDPLRREIAGQVQAERKALAERQFNPTQTSELKPNYTDAVIYTQGFTKTYTSDDYQKAWYRYATNSLYKTWRLDEDSSLKALSAATALVSALQERREKIHPDYVNDGIKKMREIEAESTARIKTILGSEVRFEAFKKMEKEFYESRANAAPAK